jgi:hypothetical protein
MAQGLLLHVWTDDTASGVAALRTAQRVAANARAELGPEVAVQVVVQGAAVRLLLAADDAAVALDPGLDIVACTNSLRSLGAGPEELRASVAAVPAAVAHLARQQWAGWAYLRV